MVVAFRVGLGSCLVRFLCSNQLISGIYYYTRREVFGSLKVHLLMRFVLLLFLLVLVYP